MKKKIRYREIKGLEGNYHTDRVEATISSVFRDLVDYFYRRTKMFKDVIIPRYHIFTVFYQLE